jgi:hypothetical protein
MQYLAMEWTTQESDAAAAAPTMPWTIALRQHTGLGLLAVQMRSGRRDPM